MNTNENSNIISTKDLKGKINLISYKNDICNLGILIYYLLFKEYLYNKYQIINQSKLEKELKINNKNLDDLIKNILITNINERISWEVINI